MKKKSPHSIYYLIFTNTLRSYIFDKLYKYNSYTSFIYLIFKSIIKFMGPTLSPTNSIVYLKLGCMEICTTYSPQTTTQFAISSKSLIFHILQCLPNLPLGLQCPSNVTKFCQVIWQEMQNVHYNLYLIKF
jgi:hypothetical protein